MSLHTGSVNPQVSRSRWGLIWVPFNIKTWLCLSPRLATRKDRAVEHLQARESKNMVTNPRRIQMCSARVRHSQEIAVLGDNSQTEVLLKFGRVNIAKYLMRVDEQQRFLQWKLFLRGLAALASGLVISCSERNDNWNKALLFYKSFIQSSNRRHQPHKGPLRSSEHNAVWSGCLASGRRLLVCKNVTGKIYPVGTMLQGIKLHSLSSVRSQAFALTNFMERMDKQHLENEESAKWYCEGLRRPVLYHSFLF